jgi:hypothetical protein
MVQDREDKRRFNRLFAKGEKKEETKKRTLECPHEQSCQPNHQSSFLSQCLAVIAIPTSHHHSRRVHMIEK